MLSAAVYRRPRCCCCNPRPPLPGMYPRLRVSEGQAGTPWPVVARAGVAQPFYHIQKKIANLLFRRLFLQGGLFLGSTDLFRNNFIRIHPVLTLFCLHSVVSIAHFLSNQGECFSQFQVFLGCELDVAKIKSRCDRCDSR